MYKLKVWSAAASVELALTSAHHLNADTSKMLVEQRATELGRQVDWGQQ